MINSAMQYSGLHVTCETLIKRLNDQLRFIEAPLQALKRQRNSSLPIARLPPEILIMIMDFTLRKNFGEVLNSVGMRAFSQVCWYWRSIVLNCPSLWRSVMQFHNDDPRWISEVMCRTKGLPLQVKLDFRALSSPLARPDFSLAWKLERNTAIALSHLSHIEDLSVIAHDPEFMRVIHGLVAQPAPRLQALSISYHSNEEFAIDPYNIRDYLARIQAPLLSRLHLTKCIVAWNAPLPRSLRHLELHHVSSRSPEHGTNLLQCLASLPHLRTLSLHYSIGHWTGSKLKRAKLASLSRLDIRDTIADATHFLQSLEIHPDIAMKIQGICSNPANDWSNLMYTVDKYVRKHSLQDVLLGSDELEFYLRSSDSLDKSHPTLEIYTFWTSPSHNLVERMIKSTSEALSFASVGQLAVSFSPFLDISTSIWADLLRPMKKMKVLKIIKGNVENLLGALMSYEDKEPLLPSIQKLVCKKIDFSAIRAEPNQIQCLHLLISELWRNRRYGATTTRLLIRLKACVNLSLSDRYYLENAIDGNLEVE